MFRYDTSGKWYKGNIHTHSMASDGGKTFRELAKMYALAGYDFLCRTDHWILSDTAGDSEPYPLLWLDGVELHGEDATGVPFHVVCLGQVRGIRPEDGLVAGLRAAREQGALIIVAHPHWCGNSPDDVLRLQPDGVEIYNHVCHWSNGKSCGLVHWDVLLRQKRQALGFAVDDTHLNANHPGWNGGWIEVNAPDGSAAALTAAIRRGNFYSSCGPRFDRLTFDGTAVTAQTSPIRFARLVGPGSRGKRVGSFNGPLLNEIRLELPQDWGYAYLEIEDACHQRAWTNDLLAGGTASQFNRNQQ